MQKHYNYLDIDLDSKNYRRLRAMQGDIKSRYILVNLYSNNLAYDLSSCTVKIYGLKRDKTIFFNNAVIKNAKLGQFEIELTNQALAVAGELKIQILVLGAAGEKLSSSAFFIDVGESIIDENAIESTNEFNVFTQAMKDFQKWDGKFKEKYDGLEAEYAENITELDSQIKDIENEKATKTELEVERQRINSFTNLAEGSTSGDAELIDARIGADGFTYANLGEGIRGQLTLLNLFANDIKNIMKRKENITFDIVEKDKIYSTSFTEGTSLSNYNSYIKSVNCGDTYSITSITPANTDYALALLYNSDGNLIYTIKKNVDNTSQTYIDYEINIPYNISKMILVSHVDNTVKINKINYSSEKKYKYITDTVDEIYPIANNFYIDEEEIVAPNRTDGIAYSTSFPNGALLPSNFCTYSYNVKPGQYFKVSMKTLGNKAYAAVMYYNDSTYIGCDNQNVTDDERFISNYAFKIPDGVNLIRLSTKIEYNFNLCKINKIIPDMTEISKSINDLQNNQLKTNFSYKINENGIMIVSKCGEKDFAIELAKKGGNGLFDFYRFGEINNSTYLPSIDFDNISILKTSGTDWHCPYIVKAINNIDGDNKSSDGDYNNYFTGGNHQYNNQGAGSTPTARAGGVEYFINGKKMIDGYGYGNTLEIRWSNYVQGYNTTKVDGTGREILQENHVMMYDGVTWDTHIELIPLEDIVIERCYGLQADISNIFNLNVKYIGGSNRKIYKANISSDCGSGKANKMILNGDVYCISMEIDEKYDMGGFENFNTPFAFVTSYGKSYFNLIKPMTMLQNDRYYFKGKYRFFTL